MQKRTFYRKDLKGNIREWSILVRDCIDNSLIHIQSGLYERESSFIPTDTYIDKGLGGKTHYEQAVTDAQTEINKKIKLGYVENIQYVKDCHETATIPKPMKGEKYYPTEKKGFLTLAKLKLINKLVGLERKYDGWRFRAIVDSESCAFYTSSGDLHPGFKHIEKSLIDSYNKIGLTNPITLDGEIYNHELGYYNTASACGTTVHFTPDKVALINQMNFYLFDACMDVVHQHRKDFIKNFYSDVVKEVETFYVHATDEILDSYFRQFLSEGYEGFMLRTLDSKYEYKRSKALIKAKPFIDDEFQIIGFEKSITGNTLGALVCITEKGVLFNCDLKGKIGSDEYKQKIWNNQSEYLKKWVSIEFLEWTPDGKPRNGKAYRFRTGRGID